MSGNNLHSWAMQSAQRINRHEKVMEPQRLPSLPHRTISKDAIWNKAVASARGLA